MMDRMPACRAIVRYGIGVDNIDRDAARARKIHVANVPDYGTEEVSDQALALVMAVARRVVTRDREVRDGAWNIGPAQKVYRLAGKTLGLIGYGRIAQAFERKMRGVGMDRVMVFDPYATLPAGVEAAGVEAICREADLVSLHAPLTPETRHILDAQRIALLKPTAIVVNTSRGPLIDEPALVDALRGRRIFGAGLDVFEAEPLAQGNPLRDLDNVVLSDHCGWYSEESVQDLQRKAAEEVARVFRGKAPLNWLNRWDN
jgi:D-3-phosphoglycerate dehydrogenase